MFKIPIKDQGIAFVTRQGCKVVHIPHRTKAVQLSPIKSAHKANVDIPNKQSQTVERRHSSRSLTGKGLTSHPVCACVCALLSPLCTCKNPSPLHYLEPPCLTNSFLLDSHGSRYGPTAHTCNYGTNILTLQKGTEFLD